MAVAGCSCEECQEARALKRTRKPESPEKRAERLEKERLAREERLKVEAERMKQFREREAKIKELTTPSRSVATTFTQIPTCCGAYILAGFWYTDGTLLSTADARKVLNKYFHPEFGQNKNHIGAYIQVILNEEQRNRYEDILLEFEFIPIQELSKIPNRNNNMTNLYTYVRWTHFYRNENGQKTTRRFDDDD